MNGSNMKEIVPVKIVEESSKIIWEPWVLFVAILALIASVVIPFAQKKYEEIRTNRNFTYYLKKQIGLILSQLTSVKLEYIEPSVRNEPQKELLSINDFIVKLKSDFNEHKNTVQPKVIFTLLMNVQRLCQFSYSLRQNISTIKLQLITEKTLEHGKELSKKELNKIYGLILVYESFLSISVFHDRFGEINSIKRIVEDKMWVGLSIEKELLTNQARLNEDLLILNDNENSLKQLQDIVLIVNQETLNYFK